MNSDSQWFKKNNYIFLVSFLTLSSFIVLFLLRSFDDNRLTNWGWAFIYADPARVFLILIFSIFTAYFVSRFSFMERYPALFLFALSFAISSIFWREPEVIPDASRYFTQAKHLEVYGIGYFLREWGTGIPAWTDMPLMPFIYGVIFSLFGEVRLYVQILTVFLFSMTTVTTYLIGKTLWNRDAGLFAGLLLLGIPYLFIHTPLMLVDVPTMFFLTFSVYASIKALECGGRWIGFASIAVSLAFFSKYSAWLMLSVLVIVFFVYIKISLFSENGEKSGRWWIIFFRGTLTMSAAVLLIAAVLWYKSDIFLSQIKLLLEYQQPGLRRWGESFISTFFFNVHPFISLSALYSVYAAVRKKDLKYLIIAWMILLVFLFQIRRSRYIIASLPALSLMASYGLVQIRSREAAKFISLCIVSFSVVIAFFVYLPLVLTFSPANLKNAGEFLDSMEGEDVKVYAVLPEKPGANIAVSVPVLDYFTTKKIYYQYKAGIPEDVEDISSSSLRFTWEYKNPDYYSARGREKYSAVVVIHGKKDLRLPPHITEEVRGYHRLREFNIPDEFFHYQTFATIYY